MAFTADELVNINNAALEHWIDKGRVWKQFVAVAVAVVWCGIGSFVLFKIIDAVVGLRVTSDQEREGLDIAEHGERAYHS